MGASQGRRDSCLGFRGTLFSIFDVDGVVLYGDYNPGPNDHCVRPFFLHYCDKMPWMRDLVFLGLAFYASLALALASLDSRSQHDYLLPRDK